MNIRQLQYFVSVYNQRSFKATAEYYSVSPQCISKMIKSLEDGINEKLFFRKGNTVMPTEAAQELFPHAMRLIEELNIIESHCMQKRTSVSIFTIDSIIDFYLKDFITEFMEKHPDINLKIIEMTNDEAITRLRKKECDFAILQENFQTSEIKNDFLFTSPFVILINRNHPASNKRIFTDHDFNHLRLAGRGSEYVIFDRTMKRLLSKNIHPVNVLESNNVRILIELVKKNLIAAAVNEAVASYYQTDDIKIIPIEDPSVNDQISLSYYSNLTPAASLFHQELFRWLQSTNRLPLDK